MKKVADKSKSGRGVARGYSPAIVVSLMAASALLFSYVAVLKYHSFSFGDIDLAVINQAFWNAVHGKVTTDALGEATVLGGGHVFGIIILLAPLYALLPSPLTLLCLQSLALALGAWPVYLIARDLLEPFAGLILAVCYLIYPALNYVNLFEFHPVALSTPLLLFMFFFYTRKRWWLFLLFLSLSLLCREDVAIPVFGFGVFGLIRVVGHLRREKRAELKWGLVPLLAGVLWFVFCVKLVQPHFRLPVFKEMESVKGGIGFYSWLGGSFSEIVKTIIFHPGRVLAGVLVRPKLLYLVHLLIPVAFLPILSPSGFLLVLISLSEGLLSQRFSHYSIRYQYSSIITPGIFAATVFGIRNLLRWKLLAKKGKYVYLGILLFSLASAKTWGPLFKLPSGMRFWKVTPDDRLRQKLVERMPPQAPVIATFEFTPKLSLRPRLFYFYSVYIDSRQGPEFSPEVRAAQEASRWALIDFNDWLTFYDFYTPKGYREVYKFLTEGKWQLRASAEAIALFQKGEEADLGLAGPVPASAARKRLEIEIIPSSKLIGLDIGKAEVAGKLVATVEAYFSCSGPIPDDWLFISQFSHRGEPPFSFNRFFFAPYRIYPTSLWQPGEVVKQQCNMLIPEEAPAGDYDLTLLRLRPRPGVNLGVYDVAMALNMLPRISGVDPRRLIEQKIIYQREKAISLSRSSRQFPY